MNLGIKIGIAVLGIAILLFMIYAARYRKAPPNTALIVYGKRGFKCVYGGGICVWSARPERSTPRWSRLKPLASI